MYEFDYPPASEEAERRQLVHIEVKFSSVIALQSSTEEVKQVVCDGINHSISRECHGLSPQDVIRSEHSICILSIFVSHRSENCL